jgi:hypothetical protein
MVIYSSVPRIDLVEDKVLTAVGSAIQLNQQRSCLLSEPWSEPRRLGVRGVRWNFVGLTFCGVSYTRSYSISMELGVRGVGFPLVSVPVGCIVGVNVTRGRYWGFTHTETAPSITHHPPNSGACIKHQGWHVSFYQASVIGS